MTSAQNKGLHMADDLKDHFFEVDHFMPSFLKHNEDSVWKRSQLMTSAQNERLHMADDLKDHFFEVNHFMPSFLKHKYKMKAVIVPYKEVYTDK
jgi:aspartokinase-like uncharacterized kinase